MNHACIVHRASRGNSFGDRTFVCTVEIWNEAGETINSRKFELTAHEGEHEDTKRALDEEIRKFAFENKATLKGNVGGF